MDGKADYKYILNQDLVDYMVSLKKGEIEDIAEQHMKKIQEAIKNVEDDKLKEKKDG